MFTSVECLYCGDERGDERGDGADVGEECARMVQEESRTNNNGKNEQKNATFIPALVRRKHKQWPDEKKRRIFAQQFLSPSSISIAA